MAGCGGISQGVVVWGQAYSLEGRHVAGVGYVAWCGAMWQGVGSCGRGWGHVAGVEVCHKGKGHMAGDRWDMWQGVEICSKW